MLLIFTTYYSQTNNLSKRTNQIIKITIRFLINIYLNINFVLVLSILQTQFNNIFNVVINLLTNKINYNFKIRDALFNFVVASATVDLSTQKLKYRQKTADATVFVNVKAKIYYNARHTPLLFKLKNYVYLRLHYDYQLFNRSNRKIFQQRYDSFLMKR